jgi:hypothetical protein
MFKNLIQNLTKNQKIGIAVFLQIIVIVVIVACVQWAIRPETHVEVINENDTAIPDDKWAGVKSEVWYLVKNNVADVSQSAIDDAVIREGTYEETTNNDITTATFLLDIDSLKQTYAITVSWSDKETLSDYVKVDCPPQSEMKYPETVCYGMYNNTYSLSLYLPYGVSPDGAEDAVAAPYYYITGDEDEKTINIMVSVCDVEKYKKEAMDYLSSTPLKLDNYTIVYEINNINVGCGNE